MLTLYHHWDSVCSFKVRMCLIEKQLDYQSRIVDLIQFQNLKPEYIALNPNGVVPTLKDDDQVIIESSIINEYLDDKYGTPSFSPSDPAAKARNVAASRVRILMKYVLRVGAFPTSPASSPALRSVLR